MRIGLSYEEKLQSPETDKLKKEKEEQQVAGARANLFNTI